MKKKISLLLCLLTTMLLATGCGSTKEAAEYDEAMAAQVAEFLIQQCDAADETVIESWKALPESAQEYQLMQMGPFTPKSFTGALDAWQAGLKECGAYLGHGDYSFEAKADTLEVTVPVQYEKRDAEILFVFDENQYLDSMTVNAKYSMGEIAEKAGLNTLLGMGTVFMVLILISFIISLFGYIPKLEEAFKKKPQAAEQTSAAPVQAGAEAPAATETEDFELIAVISAAIAAAEGTSEDGFVVRSIRRRPSNNW